MKNDLHTIISKYTPKKAARGMMGIFAYKSIDLVNEELKRRGIDHEVPKGPSSVSKMFTAMNLLCEDYNEKR